MKKYIFVVMFLFANLFWGSSILLASDKQPNILLILVDDMGYSKEQATLHKEMIEIWNQYAKDVGVILPSGGVMRLEFNE